MRPSKLKHPVAVLRQINRLEQRQLAAMAECSTATIQSIELRRLALSEELAQRISNATAVDVAWLLQGDPKVKPVDLDGLPYTEKSIQLPRARRVYIEKFQEKDAIKIAKRYVPFLVRVILKAARKKRLSLIEWQIERALKEIEENCEASRLRALEQKPVRKSTESPMPTLPQPPSHKSKTSKGLLDI